MMFYAYGVYLHSGEGERDVSSAWLEAKPAGFAFWGKHPLQMGVGGNAWNPYLAHFLGKTR